VVKSSEGYHTGALLHLVIYGHSNFSRF
jgi:hypothetical protein